MMNSSTHPHNPYTHTHTHFTWSEHTPYIIIKCLDTCPLKKKKKNQKRKIDGHRRQYIHISLLSTVRANKLQTFIVQEYQNDYVLMNSMKNFKKTKAIAHKKHIAK